jgi:serine/threonine protein kinase
MESVPMTGSDLPPIGGDIAGKYRVESVLGQGGMGAVFAARNIVTGKRVAIKWLLPHLASSASRERLMREARIAGSIEHPNVVDIYDVGEHQGGLFLVMEFLRGRTLADVIAVRGRLSHQELIPVLVPAMRGVYAAHQSGIVHRDLKPENIFLAEVDGAIVPKVLDFGVSKSIDALGEAPSPLTRTGALVGTPHYMSLEQVDGSGSVDQRTDVYGFGVLLYRALTGYFPYDGSSIGEVILKIGSLQPTLPRTLRPELPEALEAVIMRAISRRREDRFQDLEAFALALAPFAPPTYMTEDGSPRYSVIGDLSGGNKTLATGSGQRSIRSIIREAASGYDSGTQHGGMLGAATGAPRAPSRSLWAAAAAVLIAAASIAFWASGHPHAGTSSQPPASAAEPGQPAAGARTEPVVPAAPGSAPAQAPSQVPAAPIVAPSTSAEGQGAGAAAPTAASGPGVTNGSVSASKPVGTASQPANVPAWRMQGATPSGKTWNAAKGSAGRPSRVIPGDRTGGLSSDDF